MRLWENSVFIVAAVWRVLYIILQGDVFTLHDIAFAIIMILFFIGDFYENWMPERG
jgi:hypothetical protein